jgi:hypothetical protein
LPCQFILDSTTHHCCQSPFQLQIFYSKRLVIHHLHRCARLVVSIFVMKFEINRRLVETKPQFTLPPSWVISGCAGFIHGRKYLTHFATTKISIAPHLTSYHTRFAHSIVASYILWKTFDSFLPFTISVRRMKTIKPESML